MRSRSEILLQLNKVIKNCHECRLWRTAALAVPGEGSSLAKIMFVGEAPGYHEDQTGRPFVGRAGHLLESLLANVGLSRDDVFISNVVKHRPPANRAPNKDEVRACLPYLLQQIKTVNPKIIVPLGRSALEVFIKDKGIGELHGKVFKVGDRIIFPLYHPAAALRSTSVMKDLEKGFAKLPAVIKGEVEFDELDDKKAEDGQLKLV
jgi:uracil-DNA glycosylase family 4